MEFLKTVVKSQAFKELLRVLAALVAGYASSGCAALQAHPAHRSLVVFECRVAALAPYAGEAAAVLVPQIAAGAVDPVALLFSLGLTPEEIAALARAYHECAPPAPVAEPELPVLERS